MGETSIPVPGIGFKVAVKFCPQEADVMFTVAVFGADTPAQSR